MAPDGPEMSTPGPPPGGWRGWVRTQPGLVAAILVFCLVAVGGLMLTIPRGTPSRGGAGSGWASSDAATSLRGVGSHVPAAPADEAATAETVAAGPWVEESASSPSPRGLALGYAYRTLPPGGESRYQWIVRLRGAQSVLDAVDVVTWRMDPPPKNDGDLVSRDRAADGFPLFGDGPGGWFGVTTTVRYQDGVEETLSRRIEFPE